MKFMVNSWLQGLSANNATHMEELIKKIEDKSEQLKLQDIYVDKTKIYEYVGQMLSK